MVCNNHLHQLPLCVTWSCNPACWISFRSFLRDQRNSEHMCVQCRLYITQRGHCSRPELTLTAKTHTVGDLWQSTLADYSYLYEWPSAVPNCCDKQYLAQMETGPPGGFGLTEMKAWLIRTPMAQCTQTPIIKGISPLFKMRNPTKPRHCYLHLILHIPGVVAETVERRCPYGRSSVLIPAKPNQ